MSYFAKLFCIALLEQGNITYSFIFSKTNYQSLQFQSFKISDEAKRSHPCTGPTFAVFRLHSWDSYQPELTINSKTSMISLFITLSCNEHTASNNTLIKRDFASQVQMIFVFRTTYSGSVIHCIHCQWTLTVSNAHFRR